MRDRATALAVVVAVAATAVRGMFGGWLALIFVPVYVVLGIVHVIVHRRAGARAMTRQVTLVIALSHVSFLLAPLLATDAGDESYAPMVLERMLYGPYSVRLPETFLRPFEPLTLIPLVVSWFALRATAGSVRIASIAVAVAAITTAVPLALIADAAVELTRAAEANRSERETRAGGAPPVSCGDTAVPRLRTDLDGYADGSFGTSPIWLKNYPFEARAGGIQLRGLSATLGPGVHTTWFVPIDFAEQITVRMTDQATGVGITASPGLHARASDQGVAFDPYTLKRIPGVTNYFRDYAATFFIPRAGCYVVEAVWPSGKWKIALAAGE